MRTLDYPLKFTPILKEKIWGGSKLKDLLQKTSTDEVLGESWEISDVEGNHSVVANGPLKGVSLNTVLEEAPEELLGKKIHKRFGTEFPLLFKFIDAHTALSVQLHPGDELAKERHNSFGKTEMWYVVQAEKNAKINIGFEEDINKKEYLQALENGRITELLHFENVEKGDSFFIKPGKVHAIGAGVLLAEIQQTSDITYRIYDWNRTDAEDNPRKLHTALALDAIDFELKEDFKRPYNKSLNTSSNIVRCEYFTTNFLPVEGKLKKDYSKVDCFVVYMCVSGKGRIETQGNSEPIAQGETILISAINKEVLISSEGMELLEIFIE